MEEVNLGEIFRIIKSYDSAFQVGEFVESEKDDKLVTEIETYIKGKYKRYAVLGIDIYKYSQFPEPEQSLIPILFHYSYNETIKYLPKNEPFLFSNWTAEDFSKQFISTGDGGFQLMPTPLQALCFIIYFEANLQMFNSFTAFPKMRQWIGEVSLRYSLTYGDLISFNGNFYGSAIIRNSRILSRDSLNRFLLDKNAMEWFQRKIGGIENLMIKNIEDIAKLREWKDSDGNKYSNILQPDAKAIQLVNVQKLGFVKTKTYPVDIYNVFLQVILGRWDGINDDTKQTIVLSVGNTNTTGIDL